MAIEYIYPGSSSFSVGETPFGTYDADFDFTQDAPKVAYWVATRLGYPIQNVELVDASLFACFEEAVSEYGAQVNQFNIRNNLDVLKGNPTGTNYSGKNVEGSFLPTLIGIIDGYGTLVGVGGNTDIKKGSVDLVAGQQNYDLQTLFSDVAERGSKIQITKVFHEPTPAINRFFDPYSVGGQGTLNLIDEFGFGSFSPAAQFILMPIFEDMLRIQAIEFNDEIRKSAHSFNITNNKLQIFPIPRTNGRLWFEYFVSDEFVRQSTTVTPNVISDYANIGYNFIQYENINDVGRQWIRKYTLALSKELLGAIREKYSTVPIPGSEISLDGGALRAEAQTEKDNLTEQLRDNLEELSRKNQFEVKASESDHQQKMLSKIPLLIYVG
jgi:predicted DNA binding protein